MDNALPDVRRLHSYNFLSNIINLVSKEVQVITAVLLGNVWGWSFISC